MKKTWGELKASLIRFEDKMEKRFDRLETKMDRMDSDMHRIGLRVNTLENQKT